MRAKKAVSTKGPPKAKIFTEVSIGLPSFNKKRFVFLKLKSLILEPSLFWVVSKGKEKSKNHVSGPISVTVYSNQKLFGMRLVLS